MNRNKLFFSTLFAIIFLATQIIAVGAAPAMQETTPTDRVVESLTLETDPETGVITVIVVYIDETEVTEAVEFSLEEAAELGLVIIDDGTGIYVVNESMLSDEAEKEHPVGFALSEFFTNLLGVDYETIMDSRADGAGFGTIAQALWMTNALEGDTIVFSAIIEAKITKDFSTVVLPDGSAVVMPDGSAPTNWGQFRKAVKALESEDSDGEKPKNNLGAVKSGHANDGSEEDSQTDLEPDKEFGKADKETGKPDKETGKPDKENGKPVKVKKAKKNKNK